ncbi:MAG: efflux RND transporter permease subunit [Opitutae bacterium]|nr:efflux RND transporter permease subunit [Opitutae bacterium]
MLERIIEFSIRRRALIGFCALALVAVGVWSAFRVAIDAVPDITSPQVQINTAVPALATDEIELRVTVPIEREMAGLPNMVELRSLSKFGLSQVTMTFEDGVDIYRLRQLVTERLAHSSDQLPAGVVPTLAPIATGLGEIVHYTLSYRDGAPNRPADRTDQLRQLRLLHDYVVRPLLRATPGLAEVNALGGYEKQIVIEPDPAKMAAAGVGFSELAAIVRASTENAGGGVLELGGEAIVVRADTRVRTTADLAALPVKFSGAAEPMVLGDFATVSVGSAFRAGTATENGDETVLGAAVMLAGANSRGVALEAVKRLANIQTKLPAGVEIRVVYDRADLVQATIHTVEKNLSEGAVLVAVILFAMLGNFRAAAIVTLAIPLSFLFMLTGMAQARISANLMSLGAIDFGLIVDGAIVVVENIMRHLAERQHALGRRLSLAEHVHEVNVSAREVARPMFFGVVIITLVYVPILALAGVEGKMFHPMALAVMLAIGGALVLALTLMPALSAWFLRGRIDERDGWLVRIAKTVYSPLLRTALRGRWLVMAAAVLLFAAGGWMFNRLGAEFIPQLDEGSITIQMIRGNSVGLGASLELQEQTERFLLKRFPEISHIYARLGTAEIATDPMGPNLSDTNVFFKPVPEWRKVDGRPLAKDDLIELIRQELVANMPGQIYLFSQPIKMRFDEMMAGARASIVVKIYGEDFTELETLAASTRDVLRTIPGAGDVEFEALGRVPTLEITPKRDVLRRLNLHVDEINHVVSTALAGEEAGTVIEGDRRFEVVLRLPEHRRLDVKGLRQLPVVAENGVQVPLERVADLNVVDRIASITREDTQRRVAILVNPRGRDMDSFVQEATAQIRAKVKFPPGYFFAFGGQFENLQTARTRLAVVVPAALALIFVLIYASFGSVRQAALVFVCVPLAATGGVFSLALRGMPFTISAAIGFIALSGIAVLNGIMLVSFINLLRAQGRTVRDACVEGTLTRLRPLLMTALVASFGFVPMAVSSGAGAEVQRPLATVVIGGILTSTFLTLVVLPVLYDWIETRRKKTVLQ